MLIGAKFLRARRPGVDVQPKAPSYPGGSDAQA